MVHQIKEERVKEVLYGRHTVKREETVLYNFFKTVVRPPVLARPLPPRHIGSACMPVCVASSLSVLLVVRVMCSSTCGPTTQTSSSPSAPPSRT
jgi:hypothetical protein